jgi:hypothetical protein
MTENKETVMSIDVEALRTAIDTFIRDQDGYDVDDAEAIAAIYASLVPAEDEGRLREALIATLKRDDLCDPDGEHHTDEYVARFLVALDTETQGRAALAATPEPRTTGWATNTLAPTPSRDDEPSPLPTPEPQT